MLCKCLLQCSNEKLLHVHLQFGKNWKKYKFLLDARKLDIRNPKTLKLGYCTMNKEALQKKIEALYFSIDWNIAESLVLEKKIEIWNAPFISKEIDKIFRYKDIFRDLFIIIFFNFSLIQNLGSLSSVQNPSFSSPLRLCLHFLQQATKHANQSKLVFNVLCCCCSSHESLMLRLRIMETGFEELLVNR